MIVNSKTVNTFYQTPEDIQLEKADMLEKLKIANIKIKKIQEKVDYSLRAQRRVLSESQIDSISEGRNQLTDEEKKNLESHVKEYVASNYPSYSQENQEIIYRTKLWDDTSKYVRRKKNLKDPDEILPSFDLQYEIELEILSRDGIVNNLINIEKNMEHQNNFSKI